MTWEWPVVNFVILIVFCTVFLSLTIYVDSDDGRAV